MNSHDQAPGYLRYSQPFFGVMARWALGAVYVTMGMAKALDPVDFLKLVRQYELVQNPLSLNLIASTLPWFEVFLGLLLILGIAVRGSALASLAMLVPFTAIVLRRALAIHAEGSLPFCAIRFDCGCGAGEVAVCFKMVENALLILLSTALLLWNHSRFCLRHKLFDSF
jgi:uncharacterized membrane protein YphA (DoxX/SURF4 family)